MANVTFEDAIPAIRNLAGRKASAFSLRCRLPREERNDIESQLVLLFISRWPKFDSTRASVQTFASRLMDNELASILRYRLAARRQPQELPVGHREPSAAALHHFRVDIERALAPLPRIIKETASALSFLPAVDAARTLGCSRQMIDRRKRQIRNALVAAGIESNYFAAQGVHR